MANNTSQHILGTSSNLLGFCLFVITSLHISNRTEAHIIDEFTSLVAVLLTFSCVFSFISIRTLNEKRERKYESTAEVLFLISLIGIASIIVLIALNFIN